MLTLTERDNGRNLPVQVGDELELHLPETAGAGYRWAVDRYDARMLQLAEEASRYPNTAVGSGGEAIFRFRVVAAGSGSLALKYWRHWEGERSVQQRFAVTVDAAR